MTLKFSIYQKCQLNKIMTNFGPDIFTILKRAKNKDKLIKKGLETGKSKCGYCDKDITLKEEFKDESDWKEYKISGMCKKCQDAAFDN